MQEIYAQERLRRLLELNDLVLANDSRAQDAIDRREYNPSKQTPFRSVNGVMVGGWDPIDEADAAHRAMLDALDRR